METNEKIVKNYSKLYTLLPTSTHPTLKRAGLTSENGLLNVDKQCLQHNNYSNIFGLGDINNIPTTRSLYSGLAQLKIIRNNIER